MRRIHHHLVECLVIGAGLVLAVTPVRAASDPTIIVTPGQGPQGTHVSVDGSGFCATASGCSVVSVSLSRIPEASSAVAADGTFHVSFTVPGGLSYGQHDVEADQTNTSGTPISAHGSFLLAVSQTTPAPATSSPSATPSGSPGGPASPPPGASGGGSTPWAWWLLGALAIVIGIGATALLIQGRRGE
jgi:hypothetical protein